MAQSGRAAVDVDLVMRDAQIAHREHRDTGKGFVDFEQINIGDVPPGLGETLIDCANRGCGEILWRLCVCCMGDDARYWGLASRSSC